MGRRARKQSPPTVLGTVHLVVARDGVGYVRSSCVKPGASPLILAASAVAWAARAVVGTRDVAGSSQWLAQACVAVDARAFAVGCGVRALDDGAPPLGTVGHEVRGEFWRHESGENDAVTVTWLRGEGPGSGSEAAAAQILGALWWAAEIAGSGDLVRHALFTLRGGHESGEIRERVEAAGQDLVAHALTTALVDFGFARTASEVRARRARSIFRVVR